MRPEESLTMLEKLEKLHYRFKEVEKMISDPDIIGDQKR